MYNFLKEEVYGLRHQLTFVGDEMKIYLPSNYLEPDSIFANKLGNTIQTLGLFWFSVNKKMYELSLPLKIKFEYQSEEKYKGKLSPELPSLDFDMFTLKRGDAFCYDLECKEDISDLERMLLRIVDQGKMPATVSYNESLSIILNLFIAAGVKTKLGVASALVEILLSEIYRNKHNPAEPFRKLLTDKNKNASEYDFKMIRLNRVSQLNSIFQGVIGEDTFSSLTGAIVKTREHAKDRPSPFEKLIKL